MTEKMVVTVCMAGVWICNRADPEASGVDLAMQLELEDDRCVGVFQLYFLTAIFWTPNFHSLCLK